jgi:hypothetical protein
VRLSTRTQASVFKFTDPIPLRLGSTRLDPSPRPCASRWTRLRAWSAAVRTANHARTSRFRGGCCPHGLIPRALRRVQQRQRAIVAAPISTVHSGTPGVSGSRAVLADRPAKHVHATTVRSSHTNALRPVCAALLQQHLQQLQCTWYAATKGRKSSASSARECRLDPGVISSTSRMEPYVRMPWERSQRTTCTARVPTRP